MRPSTIISALLLATTTTAIPIPAPQFDFSKLRDLFSGGFAGIGGGTSPTNPSTPAALPGLSSSSANDIKSSLPCLPNVLLFARGTTEPGNIGSVVGPDLRTQINALAPGQFLFQGLDYPANVQGNFDLGRAAGAQLRTLFAETQSKCPNARIFLGGYSQGGMVVHAAFGGLNAQQKGAVGGIVTYGDPFQKQAFPGLDPAKYKTFCNSGDSVCERGGAGGIGAAHLQYRGEPTRQGAQFIVNLKA